MKRLQEELLINYSFSEQRYNLGEVGRYRMNTKLQLDVDMDEKY
jgi:hypothetical protein